MRYIKLLMPALLAGFVAACGGGGSSTPAAAETPVSVTISAQVYDQAVSNAEVSVYVGDGATPVATTTTDSNGNFTVNLSVTEAARANRCVVVARRDNISLRSLLGNIGAITDIATANGGTVTPTELPSVNVTNVSTAVAAIIEQSGALPDTQAEIDAALAVIANDPALQQTVVEIAAAIKAVVDYGATDLLGTTDTDALAQQLAASNDLAGDLGTVITSSDATDLNQLVLEVEGDPLLATQLPSDEATLVAALAGNTYVTNNAANEETLVRFDIGATTLTVADYSDIEAGGTPGTYVDNTDGSLTVTLPGEVAGTTQTVIITVTGGSTNAITANVTVNGVDEGSQVFRRMIAVVTGAGNTSQIGTDDLINSLLVDIDTSTAVRIGASCDGTANILLHSAVGQLFGATCNVAMGMLVINDATLGKTMHGLLADSWNGTTTSQQISVVNWKADATLGSVASYSRMYTPIDTVVPSLGPVLRIYPSDANGAVSAQLRFMTVVDPIAGDNIAGGNMDLYLRSGLAKSKDHIVGVTTALTGSLVVTGSVNPGQEFGVDGSTKIGVNLGNNANARLNATFDLSGAILTRYQYELSPITAADVSGKTFSITDIVLADSGTITFNADGTGTDGTEQFTWRIAAAIPATDALITSGVSDYGTTLELTFAGGTDKDYAFAKKLGTSLVVGGYNLNSDGTYADNFAVILTPSSGTSAPTPTAVCDTTGITTEAEFVSTVLAGCTVTSFADLNIAGKTFTFAGTTEEFTFDATGGTGTFTNSANSFSTSFTWTIDANGMLGMAYAAGFSDLLAIIGGDSTGYSITAITDETLAAGETATFNETLVESTGTTTALACGYQSGWDDAASNGLGAPLTPNSFAEFESVVADCGTAVTVTAADVAGNTYSESPELTTFDALTGAQLGTQANPGTGTYDDTAGFTLNFEWYVETINSVSYVVLYTNESVDPTITTKIGSGFELRETSAVTGVSGTTFTYYNYSEQSNYGDMVRDVGTDGEIWTTTRTLQ